MDKLPQSLAFFDVLPHAIRSPHLREQVGELYNWYRDKNIEAWAWTLRRRAGPTSRRAATRPAS